MLAANIDYINDSITDCQATIVQLEETKVSAGPGPVAGEEAGGMRGVGAVSVTGGLCLSILGGAGLHGHICGHQLLLPGRSPPPAGQLPQGIHRQGGPGALLAGVRGWELQSQHLCHPPLVGRYTGLAPDPSLTG